MISEFEGALNTTLYPGDERRIFLQQETQVIVGLKSNINDAARQNLLRYARGPQLDALGERYDTPRLEAQKATVVLQWTLSAAQTSSVLIEKGKRATPDGQLFFENSEDLTIPAGQTAATVKATATITGPAHNGFSPGQISTIVDPTPYVAAVVNITTSSGGADEEADDDGANVWSGYRERIRLAPTKVSTAGPEDAYIFWAKTASQDIVDVKVLSPADGEILIVVLMKNGELPTEQILGAVLTACTSKKRRPLTDKVSASAPIVVGYDLTATYYISRENSAREAEIRSAIEDAGGSAEQYVLWQKSKIGRAINPDYFRSLALNAGASRLVVTEPEYAEIEEDEVAVAGTVSLTYGGLE
ncbi:hypothetical protein DSY2174 [Desulfitobacterium hafniense Y51]|uniref:Uncharacterized protein n=1 Tax=Desulfitobacterium hafniense (strain Y51) TaxID=138119 RepID=Q24VH9_DESHY|nr:hypothetical protein DSY2174 [Desulfitobacterium hafniense Y51]